MNQSYPSWLKQRAELTPGRLAIKTDEVDLTFWELYQRVQLQIKQLVALNVKKGEHVGVLMKNSVEMIESIHAIFSIGAVAVLLNNRLTRKEIAWQLSDVQAKHLICHEEFLFQVDEEINVIIVEKLHKKSSLETDYLMEGYKTDQVATIMYTSGTTGHPKGVMQTFGNHWSSSIGSALNLGINSDDRWLLSVPLFHISGLSILFRSVIYGIGIVLFERFNAEKMNRAIMEDGVTIVSVVTTMLNQMLDKLGNEKYPETFRCMLAGGGPVPRGVLEKAIERKIPVFQTYGMTETASQIVTLSPEYSIKKLGSAGKPLFSCQMKIMKDGEDCSAYQEGEILVKGPNITKGYWKRDEATQKAFTEGWFHTGDQGYIDEDGFLFVLDRRSDLIISGGENVYPAEIENVLLSHQAVVDAGVIGIDDEKWGQVPYAFIVSNRTISHDQLLMYCQNNLARYKVPKGITFLDELPRNASNKLLRRKLKEFLK
ncbi:o-succinylbenzoate--CoA ligase [Metabacillus halosaccharovorans]|uniref:2-succinylbenzoate--CoA ligase n=1 Tax=Metabacillus halosaccharovorans TaxID=930124 RepID=A0ABT3DPY1_9BACI|nr:o-succinylbenzoate--CoA ligase [Metabacillus halosaccharovorans]MCV9888984.1 o-succinylbenzoate--CoA ligase [Metabacillus halosaccharovorans]